MAFTEQLDIVFADDSRQSKPTRQRMGPLVAVGGLVIPAGNVRSLTKAIDECCRSAGFPDGDEFRWSPGRDLWMHANLTGERRSSFYGNLLKSASSHDCVAIVVICDTEVATATSTQSHEQDATDLFLERVENVCVDHRSSSLVVVDRPPGDRGDEDKFLRRCLETIQSGTKYVRPSRILHNVLSTPSKLSRLLQAADVVVGSTLARVSGEDTFSPPVFACTAPMLRCSSGRKGGCGLKIHPDFRYRNLYHWLLADKDFVRGPGGVPLPDPEFPYSRNPDVWGIL